MANTVFSAMAIPGGLNAGKQQFSIGFELNLQHEVFVNTIDPTAWKKDVLLFTTLVRLAIRANAFQLAFSNKAPVTLLCSSPTGSDADALKLWATMLGYDCS